MNGIDRNIVIIEGEKDCSEYLMWKLLSETEFVGIDNIVCARSYKGIINNLNLIHDILFRYRVSARVLVCYDTTGYKKLVDRLKNLVDAWKPITPEQCVRVVRDDTRLVEHDSFDVYSLDKDSCPTQELDWDRELSPSNVKSVKATKGLKWTPCMYVSSSEYYAMEDCLLLFEPLLDWLFPDRVPHKKKEDITELYTRYLNMCNTKDPEDWSSDEELKKRSERVFGKVASREDMAAWILTRLTRNTQFETDKGAFADCWSKDCINSCPLVPHQQAALLQTDVTIGKLNTWQQHKAYFNNHKCGLFDTRSQLNSLLNQLRTDCTRYKVHELVEKSPMLKRLKDENPWLCWTTSNKKQ